MLIRLKILNKQDFVPYYCLLNGLIVLAALLSTYPVPLTIAAALLCGTMWILHILDFSKANNIKLTSVIFTDGRVRLESSQRETIEGFLTGQQWCTRWLAVLQFSNGETTRKLVIRSAQQDEAGDFRRLNMWLRQGSGNNRRQSRVADA